MLITFLVLTMYCRQPRSAYLRDRQRPLVRSHHRLHHQHLARSAIALIALVGRRLRPMLHLRSLRAERCFLVSTRLPRKAVDGATRVLGGRTVRAEMALAAMVLDETRVVDAMMALGEMKALGERVPAARRTASGRSLVSF